MGFQTKILTSGIIFDATESMYPSIMHGVVKQEQEFPHGYSTYFGFIVGGTMTVQRKGAQDLTLSTGMHFSVPGPFLLSGDGRAVLIERCGYRGLFSIGGPIEEQGRLCYIDNCSTTQLVPPVRLGDPTLQQLYFPKDVNQTMHIHPTIRLGYVYSGAGICKTTSGDEFTLEEGQAFYLKERFLHGFKSLDKPITVIVYHPDSDVGPTDQIHPMISRTYRQSVN